jgi:hypothetical protein
MTNATKTWGYAQPLTNSPAPEIEALDKVVEEIRRDSQSDPQLFLDQTVVPHGGE